MSPVTTAGCGPVLEHPEQAFEAYREMGVGEVVCEEKHMGSRAVLLVRTSADAAGPGVRTGRPPPVTDRCGLAVRPIAVRGRATS